MKRFADLCWLLTLVVCGGTLLVSLYDVKRTEFYKEINYLSDKIDRVDSRRRIKDTRSRVEVVRGPKKRCSVAEFFPREDHPERGEDQEITLLFFNENNAGNIPDFVQTTFEHQSVKPEDFVLVNGSHVEYRPIEEEYQEEAEEGLGCGIGVYESICNHCVSVMQSNKTHDDVSCYIAQYVESSSQ